MHPLVITLEPTTHTSEPPVQASTAEMAVYHAHASALRASGCMVGSPRERTFHGVSVPLGAAIVLHPSFAPCMSILRCAPPAASFMLHWRCRDATCSSAHATRLVGVSLARRL